MQIAVALAIISILLIAFLYVLVPAWYGLPPISTHPDRIRKALKLAELKPNETLYDLGCGHGQVLVIAAKQFGANAVGIEAGPIQCLISLINALRWKVKPQIRIEAGDFFASDLRQADVVFAYLTSDYAEKLEKKFEFELRKGARVVTIAFELPHWEAQTFDREDLFWIYQK